MIIFQAGIITLLCLAWIPQTVKASCAAGAVTAKALTTAENDYCFRRNTDSGTIVNRQYLNTDASYWYDMGTNCAVLSDCVVIYGASSSTSILVIAESLTGVVYAKTDSNINTSYKVRCKFNNNEFVDAESFQMKVANSCPASCGSTTVTLTYPTLSGKTIDASSYNADVGVAYTDDIGNFATNVAACAVTSYHIYEDAAMTTAHSTMSISTPTSGEFRISFTPSTLGTTNYWLAVNVQGTYKPVEYSSNRQFSVVASCASATVSHVSGDKVDEGTELATNSQLTGSSATSFVWRINEMLSSDTPNCPIASYKFYSNSGYTTESTKITYASTPAGNTGSGFITLTIDVSSGDVDFWFTAVLADGTEKQVEFSGTKKFEVKKCSSSFGAITQGAYPTGYSNQQNVQKNNAGGGHGTSFVLPTYSTTCTGDTITLVVGVRRYTFLHPEPRNYGDTYFDPYSASDATLVETATGSGIYKVVPTDILTSRNFHFIIKATLNVGYYDYFGAEADENYQLNIGCHSSFVTMTASAALVTSFTHKYSPNPDQNYVYSYTNPTTNPSYCGVASNAVVEVTHYSYASKITTANKAIFHYKTVTTNHNWAESKAFAEAQGMRLLTSDEAIAHMAGTGLQPECCWAAVTKDGNPDSINIGVAKCLIYNPNAGQYATGTLLSTIVDSHSSFQTGVPASPSEWKDFHKERGCALYGTYSSDNTGTVIQVDKTIANIDFTFKVRSTDSTGTTSDSATITWNAAQCNAASGELQYSGDFYVSYETDIVDTSSAGATITTFVLPTFESRQSNCNNLKIECYDETGSSRHPELEYALEGSDHQCRIKSSVTNAATTKKTYNFRVKITEQDGGNVVWIHNLLGEEWLYLKIQCGQLSNPATSAFQGGYTETQSVSKTDPKFYLPTITLANTICPIFQYVTDSEDIGEPLLVRQVDLNDPTYVQPVDFTLDQEYRFRILMRTEGQHTSNCCGSGYKLIVGCISTSGVEYDGLTISKSFQVSATSTTIEHALPTLPVTYCSFAEVLIDQVMVSGVENSSALVFPADCAQPCKQISMASVTEPQEITYKLKFKIGSSKTLIVGDDTVTHTISMTCSSLSSLVYQHQKTSNYTYIQDTTDKSFSFDDFLCSQYSCCPGGLTYTIAASNTLPLTVNSSIATTTESSTAQFTLDQMNLTGYDTYQFYIHAVNSYTTFNFSELVTVNVVFDCLNSEVFYMSKTAPPAATDIFSSWSLIRGIQRLQVRADMNLTALTGYKVDLSSRFQKRSKDQWNGCQFKGYRIDKVLQRTSEALIEIPVSTHSTLFTINETTGLLNMTRFDTAYSQYLIFVSTTNGFVWSNSTADGYLVDMSVIDTRVVVPNSPPVFTESFPEIKLVKGSSEEFTYTFPEVLDLNIYETQTISIEGLKDYKYIEFLSSSAKLIFDQSKIEEAGEFTLAVTLKDSSNLKTEYLLYVTVIEPFVPKFDYAGTEIEEVYYKNEEIFVVEEKKIEIKYPIDIWVQDFSFDGVVSLRFNQQLKVPDLSKIEPFYDVKTTIRKLQETDQSNTTSISLFDILEAKVDVSQDYTVNLVEWLESGMKLKFEFSDSQSISNGASLNSMSYHIKNGSYFVSTRSKLTLADQDKPLSIVKAIPLQLPSGVKQQELEATAAAQENALKLLLIIQMVGAILLKGSKDKLLGLISILQVIVYMPIYKVSIPANLQIFLRALRKIAEFKIVEENTIFDLLGIQNPLVNKNLTNLEKLKQEAYMQSGSKSFDILENMGYYIILLGIFLLFMAIVGIVFFVLKSKREMIKKKVRKGAKDFFWNGFFQSTSLTYLKSFVSFGLATKLLGGSKDFTFNASSLVTILLGSQLIIQPFFTGVFMMKNRSKFENKEFKEKYQSLYNDLQVREQAQVLYPMIFLLRRGIFVSFATTLEDYPFFQVQFLNLFNCFYFIYLGYVKPQKTRKSNRLELFNEFTVQILCYHLFCYTEWVHTDLQYGLGTNFMGIVISLLVFNLGAMSPELYLPLKKKYYHWKITQILFKIKKREEIHAEEKQKKKEAKEVEKKRREDEVRYADFQDFKRRFPKSREEAIQLQEELEQQQPSRGPPKVYAPANMTDEAYFKQKKLDAQIAAKTKERGIYAEKRKLRQDKFKQDLKTGNLTPAPQQIIKLDKPKTVEAITKTSTTTKFRHIYKQRVMKLKRNDGLESVSEASTHRELEEPEEPSLVQEVAQIKAEGKQ